MILHNTLSVFRFEFRRTLTVSRIGVWLLLVMFPVFIVSVMKYYEDEFDGEQFTKPGEVSIEIPLEGVKIYDIKFRHGRRVGTIEIAQGDHVRTIPNVPIPNNLSPQEIGASCRQLVSEFESKPEEERNVKVGGRIDDTVWGWVLFGLIPEVITLFGLLLWVTPVVQAELEGKTWIYLAVRPRGRASVLLGKYLAAITFTALAGWTSAAICIYIAQPAYPWKLYTALFLIVGLACLGYGALYSLIGVFMQRRAMVIAVAYTLVFEFLISIVPAVINQFTVQFRLRNLFVQFMSWRGLLPDELGEAFLGNQPAWLHILILGGFVATLLAVGMQAIQRKEYATADEA